MACDNFAVARRPISCPGQQQRAVRLAVAEIRPKRDYIGGSNRLKMRGYALLIESTIASQNRAKGGGIIWDYLTEY
jgi:hypothetical protein